MTDDVKTISTAELRRMLDQRQPVTILDVRPDAEYAEWAIPGSVHMDAYDQLRAGDTHALDGFDPPAGIPVVTVCAAGRTSLIAAELLRPRGVDVRSLAGGMKGWSLAWNTAKVPSPGGSAEVIQVRRTGKGCLSYLVGSGEQAAVIDPSLEPAVYQELATQAGWTITLVLDTHVHADHLSRARLLADATGAQLRLSAQERVSYPFTPLHDGDVLMVGAAELRALHTPGHTAESMCYLLDGRALFTGDTLFLASVGRPDLEAGADEASGRAHALYQTLRRLLTLPPETLILPGHVSEPIPFTDEPLVATLAEVRARTPLIELDEMSFVETILSRIPPTPPNHETIVAANETGVFPEREVTELEAGANRCAVMV